MLLRKDNSILFDSYVNRFLEQYDVSSVIVESDDIDEYGEDGDDEGYDIVTDDTPEVVDKLKQPDQVKEDDDIKFTSTYPEPLPPDTITQLFIDVEHYELMLLRMLSRIKFSADRFINLFEDLITGKINVGNLKNKRERAAYRRHSSSEEYMRYIHNNLSSLKSLYNQITDLTSDSTANREAINELKDKFEDIISKTNLSQRIINNVADDTIKFISDIIISEQDDVFQDTWVLQDKLQIAKEALHENLTKYNKDRNTIQIHNMRLVCKIAIDTKNTLSVLGFSRSDFVKDLVGAGIPGLMEAVDKFDYTRENRFSTAAVPFIRGAIKNYCYRESIVKIDFKIITQIAKIRKAQRTLSQQIQGTPNLEDISAYLLRNDKTFHPSEREIEDLLNIGTSAVSTDTPVGEHGEETVGSMQADTVTPHAGSEEVELQKLRQKISDIRKQLTPDENKAVDIHFNLEDFNVTKFQSQIMAVRKHFLNMKQKLNDSFDNEVNNFLSLYLEITTNTPVNAITNVGKQALVIDPSKMTGKADCPISAAAYEMYNMSEGNKPAKQWHALNDDERKTYVNLIQAKTKLSNTMSTNPAVTRPAASPNQQTQPSSKISALGAI